MKFLLIVFVTLLLLSLVESWYQNRGSGEIDDRVSWLNWLSETFTKIFYIVLITAIFCCALYNFFKNKLPKNSERKVLWGDAYKEMDDYSTILSKINPCAVPNESYNLDKISMDENCLRQKLKETQDEIQSLRYQLSLSIDNKAELESTIAIVDKEKISAEMQLELDRVQGVVELEKMRKESMTIRREIQRVLEEKEAALKEAERLERDSRISRGAAVDAQFLEDRLNTVRREAESLKNQFQRLAEEKKEGASVRCETPPFPFLQGDGDREHNTSWTHSDFAQEYGAAIN